MPIETAKSYKMPRIRRQEGLRELDFSSQVPSSRDDWRAGTKMPVSTRAQQGGAAILCDIFRRSEIEELDRIIKALGP